MSEPKRLHPIAVLLNIIKSIKELVIPFLLVIVIPGKNEGIPGWIQPLVISVIILFLIVIAFLQWFRFTYRIEEGEFRIESGVFVRKKRYIKFDRIHSIDISEGIIQRIFRLVKVNIETAGGSQADAVLSAIRKSDAQRINAFINEEKNKNTNNPLDKDKYEVAGYEDAAKSASVFKQTLPQLFVMAATSGAVGVFLSGGIAFISQFDEMIPFERIFKDYEDFIGMGTIILSVLGLVALLVVYVLATLSMVIKYASFTVIKTDDEIVISRGLLEKRQLTIPIHKIQGIRIMENFVRKPLGLATVYLEYAGGSMEDKESLSIMLFPLIKKGHLPEKILEILPVFQTTTEMKPIPKHALSRYVFRKVIYIIPIIGALVWFVKPWGLLSFLIVPLAIFWGYMQYRDAGWSIEGNLLLLSSRFFSKQTLIMQRSRIQSITYKKSWFQNRKELATISASIKSGVTSRVGMVVDLEEKDCLIIKSWYLPKKAVDSND
ncbi:PH domain-containing protein [Peribacillus sp. ACCC06369]|uniref:PH domain-containing protein n=1 Tax=Peribacillus sp. ACCC06369 TaxID=3055860 RepID=UPI0025A1876E|nr:PH domain-containing protein [Peribacillus sp. ACCC06369]MDM5356749.1 PH domain-containing protein [Peribacillus sp. ACCC06369]